MTIKERIQEKAHELFMQYGIRSVSMDDIANNLGMSKKTLYQYFADKDELVDAVVDAHVTIIQTDCAGCRKDAKMLCTRYLLRWNVSSSSSAI